MAADDRDKRPFFRRSERRSLTESIRDVAWEQRAAPQSPFEEPQPGMAPNDAEMPDFDSEPLPSFLRKEKEAQRAARAAHKQPPPSAHHAYEPIPERLKGVFRESLGQNAEPPKKPRSRKLRAARFVAYWGFVAAIWFAVILVGAVTVYSLMAEDPLKAGLSKQAAKITILADNNKVISEKGLRRNHIKLKDMPPHLIQAVLTTEDRRYYYHYGFDPIGIMRAAIRNYRAGRVVEGGSTITQQLVKVLFLKPDRTYWRKLEEVLLSLSLEYRFEKDQILELYLNRIYFGGGNYGVEAAAQHYFGKSVGKIDHYEAAILAGVIRSPTFYAPTTNLERSLERGKVVLNRMRAYGDISLPEYDAALANPPTLRNYLPSESYGFVIDRVVQQLPDLGLDLEADMVVETTIDYELQAVAQRIVKDKLDQQGETYNAGEAAAVIIDRQGAIKAMVGGRDYGKNQFNRAVQAKRQPGSTFKPFVYLTALERGLTPDSLVHDGPLRIGDWTPANYNDRYFGDVTMRDALAKSMNTVSVRLSEWAGRDNVIRTAHRLGIAAKLEHNASIALGTSEVSLLELASAYVPFANGGYSAMPHIIKAVRDAEGRTVYELGRTNWGRVVRPEHVEAMNDMLTATIQVGTGNQGSIDPHPAAGKTGTGQDYRDAWFIGYTAHYVTGVWLGNDDFTPMKRVTGGSLPTIIWRDLMVYAHLNKEPAYLPGGNRLIARERGRDRAPRGNTLWDDLFGSTGSTGSAGGDTTLGTPVASRGRGQQKNKSWLEDFFSR
jgi:penicillin-binding protein 1A